MPRRAHWMREFYQFHGRANPVELGAFHVAGFLTFLATERRVAASTQNQALAALLFLYRHVLRMDLGDLGKVVRAKRPTRLPAPVLATADWCRTGTAEVD